MAAENDTSKRQPDSDDSHGAGLSRRGFLELGAIGALSAAGAAALVGCQKRTTTNSSSSPSTEASPVESSGTDADAIKTKSAPNNWDGTYDVIVCGSGSGLVAACRASEMGATVLVLEKQSTFGGSSKESDTFWLQGSKTQQNLYAKMLAQMQSGAISTTESNTTLPSEETLQQLAQTDPETLRQQWLDGYVAQVGGGVNAQVAALEGLTWPDGTSALLRSQADVPLLTALSKAIPTTVDYLAGLGVTWQLTAAYGASGYLTGICPDGSQAGGFIARANYSLFEYLYNKVQELGADVMLSQGAAALITDTDGAVVGVESGGKNYRASKGVLLATGGMANNKDMLDIYCPSVSRRAMTTSVSEGDTGDGIRMGLGAGSVLKGWDCAWLVDGGVASDSWTHYLYSGDVQLARQPWLGIDLLGNRYPYYPLHALATTAPPDQAGILASLTGSGGVVIFDADYAMSITTWENSGDGQVGSRLPITKNMGNGAAKLSGNFTRLPDDVCAKDYTTEVQNAIDKGFIVSGDTTDALATALDMPEKTIKNAIANWNAICAKGVDEDCHFAPAWLVPLTAPYYACRVGATCLATHCGLAVLPTMQVVSESGSPITGLYACGCTLGGVGGASTFGSNRTIGGGVALACGSAYLAAESMLGA